MFTSGGALAPSMIFFGVRRPEGRGTRCGWCPYAGNVRLEIQPSSRPIKQQSKPIGPEDLDQAEKYQRHNQYDAVNHQDVPEKRLTVSPSIPYPDVQGNRQDRGAEWQQCKKQCRGQQTGDEQPNMRKHSFDNAEFRLQFESPEAFAHTLAGAPTLSMISCRMAAEAALSSACL